MISWLGKLLSARMFHHPVFIVGGSRSGTSVLLQGIGKHPHILSTPGEAPLLTSMGGIVSLFAFEAEATKKYYNESLRFSKKYLFKQLRRMSFEIACGADYGSAFLLKEAVKDPKKLILRQRWAAKTFPNESVAKGLLELFPKARFLYILRNGVEVLNSATKFKSFKDRSFEDNCQRWRHSVDMFHYLNKFDAALILRHEQLVADPCRFFKKVFSFLNEKDDSGASDFVGNTIVHPLDQPTRSGVSVKESFDSRELVYKKWSKEQKTIFREICADSMRKSGYEMPF